MGTPESDFGISDSDCNRSNEFGKTKRKRRMKKKRVVDELGSNTSSSKIEHDDPASSNIAVNVDLHDDDTNYSDQPLECDFMDTLQTDSSCESDNSASIVSNDQTNIDITDDSEVEDFFNVSHLSDDDHESSAEGLQTSCLNDNAVFFFSHFNITNTFLHGKLHVHVYVN